MLSASSFDNCWPHCKFNSQLKKIINPITNLSTKFIRLWFAGWRSRYIKLTYLPICMYAKFLNLRAPMRFKLVICSAQYHDNKIIHISYIITFLYISLLRFFIQIRYELNCLALINECIIMNVKVYTVK